MDEEASGGRSGQVSRAVIEAENARLTQEVRRLRATADALEQGLERARQRADVLNRENQGLRERLQRAGLEAD
jgi:hypothetical protein